MRASVIVVTYNHAPHVQRCLAAVLTTLSADDEVVVVDNASQDASAEVALRFGVRLERMPGNIGFGAACNHAARQSQAEFLVFLNPDTVPRHGWLEALLRGLEQADLVTAKLLHLSDPSRIDAFGNDLHISGIPTCRAWGEPATSRSRVEDVAAVSGACFAIRRSVFEELGGFDERLFLYYEDDDLSLRARLAGLRCMATPDAIVLHDHRPGLSPAKMRYLERNRLLSLLVVLDVRTLVILSPILLATELIIWLFALFSGPSHLAAKLRASVQVVGSIEAIRARRAIVQATRNVSDGRLLSLHGATLSLAQLTRGRLGWIAERVAGVAFGAARQAALALL